MEEVRIKVPPGRIQIKEAKCPNGCSLMDEHRLMSGRPSIKVRISSRGASGLIHFNSFYGLFEYESELELHDGDIIEVHCPHCNVSLTSDELCRMCNVPMFAMHLADGGEIRACPKVGCKNHSLTIVDLDAQFAEYYDEERRPKM